MVKTAQLQTAFTLLTGELCSPLTPSLPSPDCHYTGEMVTHTLPCHQACRCSGGCCTSP